MGSGINLTISEFLALALAIILLLMSTTLTSEIVESFARLVRTTFMLIKSFASINSVTWAAVCEAKFFPRMSACWRRIFCEL